MSLLALTGMLIFEGKKTLYYPNPGENELVISVSEDLEECKTGTMSITIEDEPREKDITYTIVIRPLEVKFDRLVTALTCHDFRLNELDQAAPRTVLAAAVRQDKTKICTYASSNTDEIAGKEYTWNVERSSVLTYVAKKGDKEAFRIIFPVKNGKSKPVVWVKDIPKDNACDEVKNRIFTADYKQKYQNYNLHLVINGNDCLPKYGHAEKTELSRAMTYENALIYGGLGAATCLTVTYACGALSLDAKSIATGVFTCSIGPLMGTALTFASARAGLEESWKAPAASGGILTVAGIGVGARAYWKTQEIARIKKIDELTSLPKVQKSEGVLFSVAGGTVKRGRGTIASQESLAEVLSQKEVPKILAEEGAGNLDDAVKALKKAGASDDVIEYFEELKTLRDYAKKAQMDDVAKQLDDFVKEIKGAKTAETIVKAIEDTDSTLANLGFKNVNDLWKAITDKLEGTLEKLKDKKFLCGAAGAIAGAITSSITFMATTGDVDYLTVAINPGSVATISTEGGILWAHEGCIKVNGATCPGHRW
ncbi:hypothetical protein EP1X_04210 [Thermococcus sp. EP1]|uniref:hypothetical protein n=1 Tax=Thermococcus sp. EP1 TaxID=1591054 RepID=UPI0006DA26E6|nr:hypothetical protein [Thermococcus sp. EP1]KPU63542.1 hypothetical protein EP1X_04210 [Thermococcus sp. EP1]